MLLTDIRTVVAQMRQDPTISYELPIVGRYIRKTLIWLVLTELYLVAQVLPVKFFMDELTSGDPDTGRLMFIVGSFVLLYAVGIELYRRMDWHRNSVDWGCWRIWWGYGNRCILRQSNDWHTRYSTGEKDSLVSRNVGKFQNLFVEALFSTFPVSLRIMFTTTLMFFLSPWFGLVAVLTMFVFALVTWHGDRIVQPMREVFQAEMRVVENTGSELNKNWRTIRGLGLEERFAGENDQLLRKFWQDDIRRHRKFLRYLLRQDYVVNIARAALYGTIALVAIRGGTLTMSIGTIVLATTWMERAFSNYGRFSDFQRQLNIGKEALRELVEFIQLPPSVQSPADPMWPATVRGEVTFKDVYFSYPDASRDAIAGFCLGVEPYTTTAFVGPSGCGKTTLMSLLMREYDPSHGEIRVDGVDLRQFDYGRYRREMVAMVSQTIDLFDRSIADNIRLGKLDATDDEVIEAARLAGAYDFIMATGKGFDTQIGENGIRLSGGQKQRLAIARALIRRPAILIMDEATSSLDAKVQEEVQANLNALMASRTCTIFVIAHRLSTVMSADRVVVVEAGTVSAIGTHDELQKMNGLYKELCDLELKRGILD